MEEYRKALNYSFLLLKYRLRSRKEIIDRLKRKKYSSSAIKKAIDYLEEYNYINDEEFVKAFVSASRERCWGPKRIFFALRKLGIDKESIDKNLKDKKDYKEEIKDLVERRLSRYKGKNKYQKIVRFLLGRGFYYQDIVSQLQDMGVSRFEDR